MCYCPWILHHALFLAFCENTNFRKLLLCLNFHLFLKNLFGNALKFNSFLMPLFMFIIIEFIIILKSYLNRIYFQWLDSYNKRRQGLQYMRGLDVCKTIFLNSI